MSFTEQLCEAFAVVGLIRPTNHATNTGDNTVAGIDASSFRRLLAVMAIGNTNANDATNNSVQLYWRASATSNMASPTNVASSIPVTVVQNTNCAVVVLAEVRSDQLPANTRYVQPIPIINANAAFLSLVVLGDTSAYKPGSQFDVANSAGVLNTVRAVT